MQIPIELQHFPHLTLLVISDHVTSKFFLVGGESLEILDSITVPYDIRPNHEGSFIPEHSHIDENHLKHFAKLVAEHISKLVVQHAIVYVDLIMPANIEHLVTANLHPNISKKLNRKLHIDIMKEDIFDIIKRIQKK